MFFNSRLGCQWLSVDEPEVGGDGCEADEGDPHHHWLVKLEASDEAIGGSGSQYDLREEVMPGGIFVVLTFVAHTEPAMPCQIDRQCG